MSTLFTVMGVVVIVLQLLNILVTPALIGTPRKPTSAGLAAFQIMFSLIVIATVMGLILTR